MNQAAIFLDRDNTLIEDPGYLADPNQVKLLDGAGDAVRQFNEAGYRVVVVTNQSGVARGLLTEDQLRDIHEELEKLLRGAQAELDGIYYCPYLDGPEAIVSQYRKQSHLRKPAPGMLEKAARELRLDLDYSWMIGDSLSDVQAGRAAGCRTILVANGATDEDDGEQADHVVKDLAQAARIILEDVEAEPASADEPVEETATEAPGSADSAPPEVEMQMSTQSAESQAPQTPAPSPGTTPPPAPSQDLSLLRDDLQNLGRSLDDIRSLLTRQQREEVQSDFSLARLGATLFQFLAAALLLWGLFALIGSESGELPMAIARFVLAGVIQLMALTLFLLDRAQS